MFVVQLTDGTAIQESPDVKWNSVPNGVTSVQLVHPMLNISVGLHGCRRYAFLCEGASVIQQRVNLPRLAENIYGLRNGTYIHLRLAQSGKLETKLLGKCPDLAEHVWRYE